MGGGRGQQSARGEGGGGGVSNQPTYSFCPDLIHSSHLDNCTIMQTDDSMQIYIHIYNSVYSTVVF